MAKTKAKTKAEEEIVLSPTLVPSTVTSMGEEGTEQLIAQISKKIEELKGEEVEDKSLSGKTIPGYPSISSMDNPEIILKAISSLRDSEKAYTSAYKEVIVDDMKINNRSLSEYKVDGVPVATWIKALKSRFRVVYNQDQIKKYEKWLTDLESTLSAERKRAKIVQDITKEITENL